MNDNEALVRWLFAKPDRINWLEIKAPFDTST